jgi:YD repeat-containing protein
VIKDDGSKKNFNDLEDVKERLITVITLTNKDPVDKKNPVGLPKTIEEKYWDLELKSEVFLKRIECHYHEGHLCRQDHYDAGNKFCYSLSWEYDAHGNITKEVNAEKYEITKEYDRNDNLKIEKGPRPGDSKEYKYDYANRLIEVKHLSDGRQFVTEYSYDFLGNRIAVVDHFKNKTEYTYDEFNRLEKTIYPFISSGESIFQPVSEMSYDINNNLISMSEPGEWKTTYSYNSRGKPITKTHPDGRIEKFEYYLDGTLAKTIAPNNRPTTYKRDFLGRVIEESTSEIVQTYTYKGSHLIAQTDGEGTLSEYTYDGAGRLTSETCGKSKKTISYDTLGRIEKITQSFGENPKEVSIQAFAYDFLNHIIEERLEDDDGKILQSISYQYDELGNREETRRLTDQGEQITKIKYNGLSQPINITDAQGHVTHIHYHYDSLNVLGQRVLQVDITDPKGRVTIQTYYGERIIVYIF